MVTLGDVFTVIAIVCALFLTSWASILANGLLFAKATERAERCLLTPTPTVLRGILILATLGLLSVVLLNRNIPLAKGFGWLMFLSLLWIASVGAAGVAVRLSRRVRTLDPSLSELSAFVRAGALLMGGTLLPILGWFAFAPALLAVSLGAGWVALFRRAPEPAVLISDSPGPTAAGSADSDSTNVPPVVGAA